MAFVTGSATASIELRNSVTPSVLLGSGATAEFNFAASGDLVQSVLPDSVLAIDSETIRVDFSGPLAIEAATTVAANYKITTATPGAVAPTVKTVLLPDVGTPEFLIMLISEMTNGAAYELTVVGPVRGQNGVHLASDPAPFVGVGIPPIPELVVATGIDTVRVEFSEQMKPTGDLGNAGAYVFSDGLVVNAVTEIGTNYVNLRTSEQDQSILYTATLTGVFLDGANNAMASPTATAMLGFQPFDVTERVLRLRIYNFLTEIIRLEDQRRGNKFVERYLEGPQKVWDQIYNSILNLPILWDVEGVPDQFLKFIKNIVGWTKPLEEITDALDNATLRRLIAASVAFWKARGPEDAIESILRLTTGQRLRIMNWFDFRWINDEQHLGWEWDDEADPWVVSDYTSKQRASATLAGGATRSATSSPISVPIGSGEFDGLVVFVGINSHSIAIQPPVFHSEGVERPLHPLGLVSTSTGNSAGRLALSAWMLNGLSGASGSVVVASNEPLIPNASIYVVAKTIVGLARRRDVLFFANAGEGGVGDLECGHRTCQDGDPILSAILASPAGLAPEPILPMEMDITSKGAIGQSVLRTGYVAGSKAGGEYQWDFIGSATQALTVALALTGQESERALSGDEVVYQIRIVDDGTLNKGLVRALARLTRPVGERVDILYLGFLDLFRTDDDNSQWTDEQGPGSVVAGGTFGLADNTQAELSYVSVAQAFAWRKYVVHARMRITSETSDPSEMELGVYYKDVDNRYYVTITLNSGADVGEPSDATIELRKVVLGVDTLVSSETFPDMFRQVYYTISIEIVSDDINNTNEIRVYVDENPALSATDPDLESGTITIGHVVGSTVEVDAVEMHFLPAATDFIGINATTGELPSITEYGSPVAPPSESSCPVPTSLNKNMSTLNTSIEGDLACLQPVALKPQGHISVDVNGLIVSVGDGTKTQASYFSADGGVTAKTIANVAPGDLLYWNGTLAGYQLSAGWRIDFNYNAS